MTRPTDDTDQDFEREYSTDVVMEDELRAKSGSRRRSIVAVALALIVLGFAAVWFTTSAIADNGADDAEQTAEAPENDEEGKDGEKKEKPPVPVEVTSVTSGEVSAYISSAANLVAETDVQILAEWEGKVTRLEVEEGDRIAKGEILATLDDADLQIAEKKAKVRESTARLAFERAERLHGQDLLPQEDLDKLALDHQVAQQELAEVEWRLEKTRIRAPFRGVLTARNVQLGQHVRPGDQLFTVMDFDPLVARIYLPEQDVLRLTEGRAVKISLKADEGVAFTGSIRQISPVVDPQTGTVKVTVEASSPPAAVRPGAFVRIDIVRETREGALLLPREAVVRELQRAYVFVTDGETASRRPVTLGLEEEGRVEITSGVDLGDSIVVAGQGGLKDGAKVEVLDAEGGEIADHDSASDRARA